MNEKLQYAEMLEIPTSTCKISYKQPKKKIIKKKNESLDEPKMELVKKINEETEEKVEPVPPQAVIQEKIEEAVQMEGEIPKEDAVPEGGQELVIQSAEEAVAEGEVSENGQAVENTEVASLPVETPVAESAVTAEGVISQTETVTIKRHKFKKPFKINVITVQLVVICLLVATIFITNALLPQSGINTLIANVFGKEEIVEVDDREYSEFTANLPVENKADITLSNGVMSISGTGSLYAPCDGEVTSLVKGTDGKYTVEIEHSTKFKTVISNIDLIYTSVGEKVYTNVPVGYVQTKGASMCFYKENGAVITDYTIGDDALLWTE